MSAKGAYRDRCKQLGHELRRERVRNERLSDTISDQERTIAAQSRRIKELKQRVIAAADRSLEVAAHAC